MHPAGQAGPLREQGQRLWGRPAVAEDGRVDQVRVHLTSPEPASTPRALRTSARVAPQGTITVLPRRSSPSSSMQQRLSTSPAASAATRPGPSSHQPAWAPVDGAGRLGSVEPAVDLLGALAAEQGRAGKGGSLVQMRHRHSLDLDPAAPAGDDQPLRQFRIGLRHQRAAVDNPFAHRYGRQVLSRVQNSGHLVGQLGGLRGHDVQHGHPDGVGVEQETHMAVPALHHHAAAARAPLGRSGQVGGDAGVHAVVAHVVAFGGRSQHAGGHRRREQVVAAVAGQFNQRAGFGLAIQPDNHESGPAVRLASGEAGHQVVGRQARNRCHRHLAISRRHHVGRGGV